MLEKLQIELKNEAKQEQEEKKVKKLDKRMIKVKESWGKQSKRFDYRVKNHNPGPTKYKPRYQSVQKGVVNIPRFGYQKKLEKSNK